MEPLPLAQEIQLGTRAVKIRAQPGQLFTPNAVTRLFSKAVQITPGDRVFDVGTGVGPLAVWAALEGASSVHASDVVAGHCDLAEVNARLNGVDDKISVWRGPLFSRIPDSLKADVVIGDVSGIADQVGRLLGWYPLDVPTGGSDGTDVVVSLIRQCSDRLKPGGKLYFPVAHGLSDADRIMEAANRCFSHLQMKIDVHFPLTPFQFDLIRPFIANNWVSGLAPHGSRMTWRGQIYEASNPMVGRATRTVG